jgi:hypothetical protein
MNSSIQKRGTKTTVIIRVHLTVIVDDQGKRQKREEREKTRPPYATSILQLYFLTIHISMGPLGSVDGISDQNMSCHESLTDLFKENLNSKAFTRYNLVSCPTMICMTQELYLCNPYSFAMQCQGAVNIFRN